MYKLFADIIYISHFLLIIPLFFTFYKSGDWLIYNLLLIPFMIIDQHDDGKCSLTSLEYKLRNYPNYSKKGLKSYGFIKTLINKILKAFNINYNLVNGNLIRKYLYICYMLVWVISLLRYLNFKNININFNYLKTNSIEEKIYLFIIYSFIFIYIIDLNM